MSDPTSRPPTLSISMSIDPPKFTRRSESPPTLSITVTSHASSPITIFTWHTVFNLALAQRRKNFSCTDLTTDSPIQMDVTKGPKRPGFSCELGGPDDEYYVTLEPETPVTISHRFLREHAIEGDKAFTPGHKYRLEVREDEEVKWWRYGKKEDVMAPPGQSEARHGCEDASGPPIRLGPVEPVQFEVE